MRYLALLRGINVGGANKVEMKELKTAFEEAGMTAVATYINSGNVVFSSAMKDRHRLADVLEKAIEDRFGFEVRVLLRDVGQMKSLVQALPYGWVNDTSMKCDVLFLWPDVDQDSILDELDYRPEMEDVLYTPGAVIWRIDRRNQTKSRLPRIVGTPLYKQVTVRNCNTARKLLKLMEE